MIKSELVKRLAKIHPYLYQRDSVTWTRCAKAESDLTGKPVATLLASRFTLLFRRIFENVHLSSALGTRD